MGINCILNFFKIFIRTKVSLFEHICLFVCNTRLGEFLSLPIAVDMSGSFFVCNKQRNFWSNWNFGGIQNAVCPHFELMNILKKWLRKKNHLTSNLEKTSWHVIMSPTLVEYCNCHDLASWMNSKSHFPLYYKEMIPYYSGSTWKRATSAPFLAKGPHLSKYRQCCNNHRNSLFTTKIRIWLYHMYCKPRHS